MSGPIRSALMTAKSFGGRLELNRAKEAKKRAPGQVSPSKYMPDVPRQVRADGGPLRLYHGTEVSHPIDELDPFISPDQLGIHLGDAATANRFATRTSYDPNSGFARAPRVIPFDAKMQNPLRLHDKHGTWDPSMVYKQLVEKGLEKYNPQVEERLANLESGSGPTGDSVAHHGTSLRYQKQAVQEVHDMIRKHGYDGVVYLNRYEMPTDEAKARMEDVKRPGYIMRGQLSKMTDDEFKKHFPEATDSYIAFDAGQLESPFGKGPGVGYADGGEVDDQDPTPQGAAYASENDLLQPIGKSRMVGDEKMLFDDGMYKAGVSGFSMNNRKSIRYLHHDENGNPIGALQIQTEGPRSKNATIQNVYVAEPFRRSKVATGLLKRARQDFDVKHSTDLTTAGRGFAKAVKSAGGEVEGGLDQFFGPTHQSLRRRYYTGTSKDKDFTAFQESRHGTWLTDDPKEASDYAEQNDSQGYRQGPGWTYEKTNTASRVIPAYVRIENPYTGELPDFVRTDNYKKAQSDWFDTLRRKGHDAWVPASGEGRLVVKLTNQGTHIKSAIGNSGAYNLTKKHLAKAEGGTVDEQKNEAPAARLGDVAQAGGFPLAGGIRGGEGVLPASLPPHGEVDLTGLPTNIKIPKLGMSIVAAHNPVIRQAARDYARAAGIDYNPPTSYQRVDPERATRIAHAYENMEHDPSHPLVKASYEALKQETLAQYQAAKAAGLKAEFYPDPTKDPYRSQPRLMSEDVNKNNHMYVYPTDAGFGTGQQPEEHENNPLLGDSGERWNGKPVTFNDLFRAVHDYYGHVKEGVGFRGDGEENAWRSHAAMYSPLARIAMGSETRGQNSLLNYGPNGERNRNASTDDTFFSPQKLGVLPVWVHHDGAEFIKPEERAQMEAIYKNFGVDPEGVVGASIRNSMSVFPKPQRMFPEEARPPGGQYLAMPDKRDITGHKAAAATIGVQPGGKPFFKASADAVEQTGSTGRGTAMARANLFKQKAGWKWLNAPEEHASTDTIVSVEHRGKHHYALNAHFPRGVDLARYENSPTEPRLRPTTTGNVELGPQAGSILVRGKEHPVYRHVVVKKAGGLVAPQYENPVKLAKKALMAAKKTGSRS